jgi:hypothetical protein
MHLAPVSIRPALAVAAATSVLLLSAGPAHAASADEQKCINEINKRVAGLMKTQGKVNDACLKDANAGDTDDLGNVGQEQSAQACPGNDVKGKVAKSSQKLVDGDTDRCTVDPPSFGYAGTAHALAAATGQSSALAQDLFGLDLDAATLDFAHPDAAAAECQQEVLKNANRVVNTLWKLARKAKKDALKGKGAPPVDTATDLALAVLGYLEADANSKAADAQADLAAAATDACTPTAASIAVLFRGRCATSPTIADLATCAGTAARCRMCQSLGVADGLTVDCDDFDNGDADDSCPGLATAREITDSGDLISGPLAHGKIGDYLIENEVARFIIQDVGIRDLYSVGCFGGNIIDVELIGHPGLDNFLEIQPAVNMETVINAQTIEIVNDGSDGTPAIVRTCGPDDILDFVNPSTVVEAAGFTFPASADDKDYDVEGCTDYILAPGAAYLKMVTTMVSEEPTDVGLFVGDFINASGEVEMWGSAPGTGIGEQLTHFGNLGVLSYIGYRQALGVDYSHVTLPDPNSPFGSSLFSTSGVAYVLHSHRVLNAVLGTPPTFEVPAGGSNSFTRYFGVGDGSGANAVTLENLVKSVPAGTVEGCVTVDGVPAPAARVTAGPQSAGALTGMVSNWTTDTAGCYRGTLPEGSYGIAAWREGALFEGAGPAPLVHTIGVVAGETVVQDFDLPATGVLDVVVTDEGDDRVPARIMVVGFDPSPELTLAGLIDTTGVFRDQNDVVPFGVVAVTYADANGEASFEVEPGSYQVFVSRGSEYSTYDTAVTITGGATTPVTAQIARVIDTDGFVSSDFHVHGINSADSRVSHRDRIYQFAGEGVDNVIMTDHHSHTDLVPTIVALGFDPFVTSTIGEEITTWDTGHFNAYPMTIDPTRQSGGSTDWAVAAPPGMDFVEYDAYGVTPAGLELLATAGPQSTPDTVVQINHIDSHFVPLKIDTSLVPPASAISMADKIRFRIDPTTGNLFHHFKALELWNGDNRGDQSQFLDQRMGIWFNHLNQGLLTTFIADTDTHRFTSLGSAGARTWTASSSDDPPSLSSAEVAQAVAAGRATGGQGVYVQTRLVANEDPLLVADLTLAGSTLVSITDAVQGVDLEIEVQAPTWAPYDRIEIYANATTIPSPTSAAPELFSATPTVVLDAGVDFSVNTVNVFPAVPGADRLETTVSVPFTNLAEDTWFVVVVRGTDGVSEPMFPIFPKSLNTTGNTTLANLLDGNLSQGGTMALGATNALYVDADGTPGFQAPLAP